jgi:hypothetical protein
MLSPRSCPASVRAFVILEPRVQLGMASCSVKVDCSASCPTAATERGYDVTLTGEVDCFQDVSPGGAGGFDLEDDGGDADALVLVGANDALGSHLVDTVRENLVSEP